MHSIFLAQSFPGVEIAGSFFGDVADATKFPISESITDALIEELPMSKPNSRIFLLNNLLLLLTKFHYYSLLYKQVL